MRRHVFHIFTKNEGAPQCHRIFYFLAGCFHKQPLTSRKPFCFIKRYIVEMKRVLYTIFGEPKNGSSTGSSMQPCSIFIFAYLFYMHFQELFFLGITSSKLTLKLLFDIISSVLREHAYIYINLSRPMYL